MNPKPIDAARARGRRADPGGRRLRRRLRRGRRRDRRDARAARTEGGRARGAAGYFNEADFNHARAVGLPRTCTGAAGRQPTADLQRLAAGRGHARAAARRSTGRTACARRHGCASSGRASTGSRASTDAEFDRHLDAVMERISVTDALLGAQRAAAADEGGRGAARVVVRDGHAQRRPRRATTRRPPATWASATRPAPSSATHEDLPPGRRRRGRRRRRALLRASGCWSRTAARPGSRRPDRPATRAQRERDRARPAGRRRRRLAGVAGAAAALRDRRPGGGRQPAPAPVHGARSAIYGEDQQAWWGAPHAGLVDEFAQRRRRLRLPARGRAVHDRRGRLGAAVHDGARAQAG